MDLTSQDSFQVPKEAVEVNDKSVFMEQKDGFPAYVSMVDPFLVEALQNPRHRLTSWFFYLFMNLQAFEFNCHALFNFVPVFWLSRFVLYT